jgi:hypothetical protein
MLLSLTLGIIHHYPNLLLKKCIAQVQPPTALYMIFARSTFFCQRESKPEQMRMVLYFKDTALNLPLTGG